MKMEVGKGEGGLLQNMKLDGPFRCAAIEFDTGIQRSLWQLKSIAAQLDLIGLDVIELAAGDAPQQQNGVTIIIVIMIIIVIITIMIVMTVIVMIKMILNGDVGVVIETWLTPNNWPS